MKKVFMVRTLLVLVSGEEIAIPAGIYDSAEAANRNQAERQESVAQGIQLGLATPNGIIAGKVGDIVQNLLGIVRVGHDIVTIPVQGLIATPEKSIIERA